jgi:monoterpene epsilon-lactone hydrolase
MRPPVSRVLVRRLVRAACRWAFAPSADWPTRRRRLEVITAQPKPRTVSLRHGRLGGVPVEVLEPARRDDDLVLLFLHGGGYTLGSPRTHRAMAGRLAAPLRATAYVLDYRLAPEHPYPAAGDDVLAAYRALVSAAPGRRVIVAGDSAGGALTLELALAARELDLPLPAALGLIYPGLDLRAVRPAAPREPCLTTELLSEFVAAYQPADPASGPSPLQADLAGLPPMVITTGADDLIVDDSRALAVAARAAGVPVRYREYAGWFHGFFNLSPVVPQARRAVDDFARGLLQLSAASVPRKERAGDERVP